MVGLVVVSHSAALAGGVVELASQMGGGQVAIEPAGGMSDPPGAIGTDVELVRAAIERVAGDDGVLVLMDLGSAVMSAEMAAEMIGMEREDVRVVLSAAPLVEGAVAAAARAGAGASLDEVAGEALSALSMKLAAVGGGDDGGAPGAGEQEPAPEPAPEPDGDARELRVDLDIPLGLHARPAARVVEAVGALDARVTVADATTGRGPVDARSLSALVTLGARQGDTLVLRASGTQAGEALEALGALAAEGFGDRPAAAAAVRADAPAPGPAASGTAPQTPEPEPEPPAPGTVLRGLPVAPGIVIAPARPAAAPEVDVPDEPAGDPAAERARLDEARDAARRDVEAARERVARQAGTAEAEIFGAHLLLLDDATLVDPAHAAIDRGRGAARAWRDAVDEAAAAFRALEEPYLRERAADVADVGDRVLRHLAGVAQAGAAADTGVLVAADLTPGEAAALDRERVLGIALAQGAATSHAAILARALGIPSVAGLGPRTRAIAAGTTVVLDGTAGTLEVDPPAADLERRERARAAAQARRARARARAHEPAQTRDGSTIEVAANIGSVAEAAAAVQHGADGVGLLRTEFLFLDRDEAPTEDEQRAVLADIAQALDGRPLIVRTLDAGADKPLRYLRQDAEDNPFLGVRGLRLGLARPDLLDAQLRAIAAVAAGHPLRVMFPMVSTLAEYRAARERLERAREQAGGPPIEAGIMVEVPAVAVAAERFAREVDFFSIGTNDLTQYTMAAERGNPAVAALAAGPVPPVLALVRAVTAGAAAHGRWVGVCGELAGDPAAAVLLAGLGVQELSMAPPLVPEVKEALRGVALADAGAAAVRALEAEDGSSAADFAAPLLSAP